MKPLKPYLLLLVTVFLLLSSCKFTDDKDENKEQKHLYNLLQSPNTNKIVNDSIIIHIPGKNGFKKSEIITSKINEKETFSIIDKIIPGESYLPLGIEEKIKGVKAVKSSYPKKTEIQNIKKYRSEKTLDSLKQINIAKALILSRDSISNFKSIVKRKSLFTIQNGDTIYPPLAIYAKEPERSTALKMQYTDDAVFDISYLGVDQGLPSGYIRNIQKDSLGIFWLTTHGNGLISYDGYNFSQYTEETGLSDNQIISSVIDDKNNLWLGTINNGISFFDGEKFIHYTEDQGLPSNMVLALEKDQKGRIWAGTRSGLVCFENEKIKIYTKNEGLPTNPILALRSDKQGNLWIGTYGRGISKWDGERFTNFNTKDGLAGNFVYSILQDHNGNIWIGTQTGGVSKFDGSSFLNYDVYCGLRSNAILAIEEIADSLICIGTFGEGLVVFDGEAFVNYGSDEGMYDSYIRTLYKDEYDNLWIGTDGGGLIKFNTYGFVNITAKQGFPDDLVVSAMQDKDGGLWMGVFRSGVVYLKDSPELGKQQQYIRIEAAQGLLDSTVTSIFQDSRGDVWLGTYSGGLSKIHINDFKRNKFTIENINVDNGLLSNITRDIIEDEKGYIWIATDDGLVKYNNGKLEILTTKTGLAGDKITSIFQDKNKNLWVGTIGGGLSIIKGDSITNYTKKNGLPSNNIWSITQDDNNIIWLGTRDNGLCYFNGKSFFIVNEENGLCDNEVYSITQADSNLWVGTTNGLSQLKLKGFTLSEDTLGNHYQSIKINNYDTEDGLKAVDFYHNAALLDDTKKLWLGSVKSLVMLDLAKHKKQTSEPMIFLDKLIINDIIIDFFELNSDKNKYKNQDVSFTALSPFHGNPINLSLPVQMNHLTFNCGATDWVFANKIKFQFKLEGYDLDWSKETSNNIADYKNLSPGNYVFKMRAKGASGKWSNTFEYRFNIRYPWWLSWWAMVIYVLAFLGLVWLVIDWRVSIVKRQKLILESIVAKRTKELNEALVLADQAAVAKTQFVANMSHEIRTPLTAILGLTKLSLESDTTEKIKSNLSKILGSAENMLVLINDLLDFSKVEAGKLTFEELNFNIQDVLSNILVINSKLLQEKDIELIFKIAPDVPENLIGDPVRVGQVISNLLNNAIKFTDKGNVIVDISVSNNISEKTTELLIAVKDNGIGIDDQHLQYIFNEFEQADNSITRKYGGSGLGLAICKSLVTHMKGKIWVESKINEGSTFYITIQLAKDKGVSKGPLSDAIVNLETLIIEKNMSSAETLQNHLKFYNLNSIIVNDIENVFNHIENQNDYVVFVNDNIISGLQEDFISKLKSAESEAGLKIISIKDSDSRKQDETLTSQLAQATIIKPVLPKDILQKLDLLFNKTSEDNYVYKSYVSDYDNIKSALDKKSVLVVEDNEIVQDLIRELLTKVGLSVEIVMNGLEAVNIVEDNKFDLILMDMHMPVMDGFTASKTIRSKNVNTPIIILTADTKQSLKEESISLGINDVITKPIDTDLFYSTIIKSVKSTTKKLQPRGVVFNETENDYQISFKTIDVQSGIKRFAGNKKLFIKILYKFMHSNEKACDEIKELINKENYKDAYLKCHSLKGESANISANDLFKCAEVLETSVKEKDMLSIQSELNVVEQSLNDVIAELNSFFESASEGPHRTEDIKILLNEIITTLNKRDPKVFDLMDDLINYKIDRKIIAELDKAVSEDENEKAMKILNSLISKFND